MPIAFESPDQADVRALIEELDAYHHSLYPAECVYALDLSAVPAGSSLCAVSRDSAGVAVACGAVLITPGYGELKRIFVHPAARGQGLAQRLISALEQAAVQRGCRVFMLETGPAQPAALQLYERMGYRRRGPFGTYQDDPHSVFMEKHVTPGQLAPLQG